MALLDDYLPLKSYQGKEPYKKDPRFSLFKDTKTQKYYFAYLDYQGGVLFRSEGYNNEKSCANGIKSVLKNIEIENRFFIIKINKKYIVVLKAGNNQEIARSVDFTNESSAQAFVNQFFVENKPQEKSEGFLNSLDAYLPIENYLNKDRIYDSYGITGFVKFLGLNNKFYFGVYNPDASLYLRSAGYLTEDDRDNAFDLMESTILLEENYKIELFEGSYYAVLFEEEEILAISAPFASFIAAFVTTPGGRPKDHVVGTMF
jgi:uncharacterized protein YegP (UPF0339 family)